mgnify:CR=1 FL=1
MTELFEKYKDKVKNRKVKFHIKGIFNDWWDDYKIMFADKPRRPIIYKVVDKFLKCKSFLLGYSLYKCTNCDEEKIVPNTCKTRFCPSCGNKYNEDRAISIFSKLFKWSHRHVVFTIPEDLRIYFRNDRTLLKLLFDAAAITIKSWFINKYKKEKLKPAFISVLHTYGRPLNFNPHIHMILLAGGISKTGFKNIDFFAYASFRKRFMKVLLDLLEEKIGKDKFRKIKNDLYRRYPDGFYVYAPKSKFKSLKGLLTYVCRYLSRPVMAESRILDYDGKYVTFWYQRHEDDVVVIEKIHAYEFIKRLIIHIPEPNFRYIRFYGAYNNRTKIHIDVAKFMNEEQIKFKKSLNKWRCKILINFHVDPLICPKCHEEMVYYSSYTWYWR